MTRVVAWNMKVGRHKGTVTRELTRLINLHEHPAVVALSEASTYQHQVRAVARAKGYRRPITGVGPPGGEGASTVLLVSKRVRLRRYRLLHLLVRWRGPKGRTRPGRRLPLAVVRLDGKWVRVVGVHMPTGRHTEANRAAWNETIRGLEVVAKNPAARLLFIGDWNCPAGDQDIRSVATFARRVHAEVVRTGAHVDYAVVRGIEATGHKGDGYGSDHPAVWLELAR